MDRGQTPDDAGVAEVIADHLSTLSFDRLAASVVDRVEAAFVDTVGVGIRGAQTDAGRIASEIPLGEGDVTLWSDFSTGSITRAGFANGTACHALDFDDVTDAIIGHPSACLVPAILAVAETRAVTGEEAITGYVAGFETAAALSRPINPGHYERGWHATATLGAFGAAAATASTLALGREEATVAIKLAASMASGLKRNFGSMAKPMHVGLAVRSGLTAGLLAARGFDAARDPIGTDGGFLDLYAGDAGAGEPALTELGAGELVDSIGIDEKKYPCCYFTHSAIEAALEAAAEVDDATTTIESVKIAASRGAFDALAFPEPETPSEARFSMHQTVAAALADGRVGLETFDPGRLGDPRIVDLRDRVEFTVDDDLDYASYECHLDVRMVDGRVRRIRKSAPPGSKDNPLSESERFDKFAATVGPVIGDHRARTLYDRLIAFRDEPRADGFLRPLRAAV